ncbi:MAG TPA: multicopper oxidase domain-containing protein, partial [Halioglobus sp.]
MNDNPSLNLGGLLLVFSLLVGCGGSKMDYEPQSIGVAPALDTNPDPNIFETTLTAAPYSMTLANGQTVRVFAYNGQVPGPEIRVKRGDRVIVRFKNQLPDGFASTIHWHGVELNNQSDGTEHTQDPVDPGETYVYDFIAPRAGTFWYHPHVRGIEAVAAGLYAPLIVTQPEEAQLVQQSRLPGKEMTLVLSDLAVEQGMLKDLSQADMLETMNGTEGNILLVNGRELPTLSVAEGDGIRLRLINAAIARYYRLALSGHDIFRVGGQGGLLASVALEGGQLQGMRMPMDESYTGNTGTIEIDQGYERGEILLAPGERADVVIVPKARAGESVMLQWVDFARGRHQMAEDGAGHGGGHGVTEPMGMVLAEDDGLRPSVDLLRIQVETGSGNRAPFTITEGTVLTERPATLVPERTDTPIELQEDMEAMMADAPRSTWFKIDGFAGIA